MRSIFALAAVKMPTFTADVPPTALKNCLVCHRKGEVISIALASCRAVRPWVRMIEDKGGRRQTPPRHADPAGALIFGNDRKLSRPGIDKTAGRVRVEELQGPVVDLPVPPVRAGWQIQNPGQPDAVVRMPEVDRTSASRFYVNGREILFGAV